MKPSENPKWLAVEGWCTPEEGDALYEQASKTEGAIVELGTAYGRSTIALALAGKRVTTIDCDERRIAEAVAHFHIAEVLDNVRPLYGAFASIAHRNSQEPVSLLYIDGWHDSENVRADYAAWAPHVVPNGAIWFHDAYGAGWPDVHALVDELVASEAIVLDGYVGTIAKCRKVAP